LPDGQTLYNELLQNVCYLIFKIAGTNSKQTAGGNNHTARNNTHDLHQESST